MSEAAVELSGVTKSYGGFHAVDGIDLSIPRGSIFGLLGPNGAGKTTTIRMTMSILAPDSGTVRVLGQPAGFEANRRVGYLPEERGLYRKMRVVDQLLFLAEAKGVDRVTGRRRVAEWLDRFGLSSWASRKTEALSKGMQQKVQFIATVLHEPELLILDEPFTGLDPVNALLLKEQIDLYRRNGRTVVFSTHVLEQAEQLCDSIALINRSKKVLDGPLGEIKQRFRKNTVVLRGGFEPAAVRALGGVREAVRKGESIEVALDDAVRPQEFLRSALDRLPVTGWWEKQPTLEEIFIEVVNRDAV